MTPKEKAEELFEKMYSKIQPDELGKDQESAKQCALIAVDELIKLYEFENPHRGFKISYWDDVKTEIEKL